MYFYTLTPNSEPIQAQTVGILPRFRISAQHQRLILTIPTHEQASNRGQGHWQIHAINGKAHTILNYHSGSKETALLEEDNGKALLNGLRYFVVKNDRCQ
jgi:hypothetical protein